MHEKKSARSSGGKLRLHPTIPRKVDPRQPTPHFKPGNGGRGACFRQATILMLACFVLAWNAHGGLFPKKSISTSGQFVIYCDDLMFRLRVAGLVEEEKQVVLKLLGAKDQWKYPILINVDHISAARPGIPVSRVRLIEVDDGFKVEMDLYLGEDPREMRLEEQIIRAILLEYSYRLNPPSRDGEIYVEPPAWLIEGVLELYKGRERGTNSDVYKALIDSNHVPKLEDFLSQSTRNFDSTSLALYRACSIGLVELLTELPDGRASLAQYLCDHERENSSIENLKKYFPSIAGNGQSLEKWWSLSLARLSASERYKGLTLDETDRRLTPLLSLQIPLKKGGGMKIFTLDQYKDYLKIPESRNALKQMALQVTALNTIGSAQLRPVISEYYLILMDIVQGKTRGLSDRIADVEKARQMIIKRTNDIADYLNWYEATQMKEQSDSFKG